MREHLRPALVLLAAFTALTGLVYPLTVTVLAQRCFPHQANGSLFLANGVPAGSDLIGQELTSPADFWGRLSSTTPVPYNAAAGAGSNLGPLNPALREAIAQRAARLREADPDMRRPVPVDLVTASGSGLEPHISPAAAWYQVGRVARSRGLPEESVCRLVKDCTESRQWGFLGEPRVNVVRLNAALDAVAAPATPVP